MRYPLSKYLLLIAIAAWSFRVRPFSFVVWTALVSVALFVFMYAWEKYRAAEPMREAIRKDRASALERHRDRSRSIL